MVAQVHRGLGHVGPRVGAGELGAVVAGHVQQTILISGAIHCVSRHLIVMMVMPGLSLWFVVSAGVYGSQSSR